MQEKVKAAMENEQQLVPSSPPPGSAPRGRAGGAASAYWEKKALQELEEQLQRLREECQNKSARITELEDLTSNGRLQKQLQKTLEDNRDMRRQLDILEAEKERADSLQEQLEEQRGVVEHIRDEMLEYQKVGEQTIAKMKEDHADVDSRIENLEIQLEESKKAEKLAVDNASELKSQVSSLEEARVENEVLVARLKDGSRIGQLEQNLERVSELLHIQGLCTCNE